MTMTVDFKKLETDLRAAKKAALAVYSGDGGSCNWDACALSLPKGTHARKFLACVAAAGLSGWVSRGARGRTFAVNPIGGQGAIRTLQAEAMVEALKERGWDASMWWQVD